jgi:hypothetical protein
MGVELHTGQTPTASPIAESGTTGQDVFARVERILALHQEWREGSSRWPTDAQLDGLEPIHDDAIRLMKELEAIDFKNWEPTRVAELSTLHWRLQNIIAVPMDRLQTSVRQGEALENSLMGKG